VGDGAGTAAASAKAAPTSTSTPVPIATPNRPSPPRSEPDVPAQTVPSTRPAPPMKQLIDDE